MNQRCGQGKEGSLRLTHQFAFVWWATDCQSVSVELSKPGKIVLKIV